MEASLTTRGSSLLYLPTSQEDHNCPFMVREIKEFYKLHTLIPLSLLLYV